MNAHDHHNSATTGLAAGIFAYIMWGLFPIYFKLTEQVPPVEILAHRIAWSVPFGALIIHFRHQWSDIRAIFTNMRTLGVLALAALFIALNWGLYIWAIQDGQIFQASLGYYINPLIFVLIGVVFLNEHLSRLKLVAVIFAAIGVGVLTFYGGKFPWISLSLAISFTAYGVIRKKIAVGAMPGLFVETLILFLPAIAVLFWIQSHNQLVFLHTSNKLSTLLILAGPITVLPLVAFAFAARRLKLSTIGFLQFIGPSLQFLMGVLYGEKLTLAYLLCFGFIWLAVILFSWDALRSRKTA
ncbi:MAG TPA: EamA family transporter RarD [Hellea balneolensis]|uniref:EamA family transporter RarD n=1 Tax=Hellea balneolensis TaxID=287478 RepID=A0A7C3GLH7_9PROT|nr:EamA family transporter RarD [Hellea balneolensis]